MGRKRKLGHGNKIPAPGPPELPELGLQRIVAALRPAERQDIRPVSRHFRRLANELVVSIMVRWKRLACVRRHACAAFILFAAAVPCCTSSTSRCVRSMLQRQCDCLVTSKRFEKPRRPPSHCSARSQMQSVPVPPCLTARLASRTSTCVANRRDQLLLRFIATSSTNIDRITRIIGHTPNPTPCPMYVPAGRHAIRRRRCTRASVTSIQSSHDNLETTLTLVSC